MNSDVLPRTEDGKKSWAENIILKFPPLASSLGFNADDEKEFLDLQKMLIFSITAAQSANAEAKAWTAFKKQILNGIPDGGAPLPLPVTTLPAVPAMPLEPGVIARLREIIQRIKTHKGYTDAVGEQLQIDGSGADDFNPAEGKPSFDAVVSPGKVTHEWVKGDFDGVVIESRRGAETLFTFLDKDFKSPFPDMRPNLVAGQPETRRYRMIYLLEDEIVGTYSDEVVITTMA